MPENKLRGTRPWTSALAIALLIILTTTAVTFIMPEQYGSTAVLQLKHAENSKIDSSEMAAPLAMLSSEAAMKRVIVELGLAKRWAQRYGAAGEFTAQDAYPLLKKRISIQNDRSRDLIQINVYSEDRMEPAAIANRFGEIFGDLLLTNKSKLQMNFVDRATPGLRPISPNISLNISIGVILGLAGGGLVLVVSGLIRKFT